VQADVASYSIKQRHADFLIFAAANHTAQPINQELSDGSSEGCNWLCQRGDSNERAWGIGRTQKSAFSGSSSQAGRRSRACRPTQVRWYLRSATVSWIDHAKVIEATTLRAGKILHTDSKSVAIPLTSRAS
jgi:hypothetical protein